MDHIDSEEARTAETAVLAGPTPSLLAGLTHAMHEALVRERERIDEMVAADAKDHVEKARARAAIEAAELRRLAEDEVREIEAWAAREIKRIRKEAGRRSKERRADMTSYLQRHDAIIETEIAGLGSAVADYSATLARFVEDLAATSDPGEIARRADSVPTPPDMDEVRASARARAVAAYDWIDDAPPAEGTTTAADASDMTSDPGVAVMDPEADGRRGDLPLAVDPQQVPEEEAVAAGIDTTRPDEGAESPRPDEAAEPTTPDDATEANGQPRGALRIFRALVPWAAASDAQHAKDTEARRS